MSETAIPGFSVVIPAGGSGSRLWPLSRADAPKFLHDLSGNGKSLLRNTYDRLSPMVGTDGVYVVTGEAHLDAVKSELPRLPNTNLLVEPSGKDSAAAIALAVMVAYRKEPSVIVGSFAADHVISDDVKFRMDIAEAVEVARGGTVVTVGIRPTEPSSAFGYVEVADRSLASSGPLVVSRFVEKPDYESARNYIAQGNFFWNAGMFVAEAKVILDTLELNSPGLVDGISRVCDALEKSDEETARLVWDTLPRVAIDYVLAEPAAAAGKMSMVVANFDWDDVGDFAALAKVRQFESQEGVTVVGSNAKVVAIDASGVVVSQSRRVVSLVGVSDIVVVDTPDALLVTTKAHAQDVKKMVEHMKLEGLDGVL